MKEAIIPGFIIALVIVGMMAFTFWTIRDIYLREKEYKEHAPVEMPDVHLNPTKIIGLDPYTINALAEAIACQQAAAVRRILEEAGALKLTAQSGEAKHEEND